MKVLYLDCKMGASGDMLMSALSELLPDPDTFINKLNGLNIPHVRFKKSACVKCGIVGTHIDVLVDGNHEDEHVHDRHGHHHEHCHEHSSLHDIEHVISHLNASPKVKQDASEIYKLIAHAEAKAHGSEVELIHFHEVGAMDAVADIVGACMLMEELAPDKVIASPVNVGGGTVKCAHGTLPVPAPATAFLLEGIPAYGGEISSELCTPTGAALLRYFVSDFSPMPMMRTEKIGYGMGTKDFDAANCLRAFMGKADDSASQALELCCNLDDMTGEALGFAMEQLFEHGALDVYTIPAGMKKGRPGVILTCLCREDQREEMLHLIFKHTSTLGIRERGVRRYTLERSIETISTEHGEVRIKNSTGYGVQRRKPEYEDIAKIARENHLSLEDITK